MSASLVICVLAPVRIVSEANCRDHWRKKAQRVAGHRRAAFFALSGHQKPRGEATITLTRIGPKTLDTDNLAGGFKGTRDGIADWLGIDDGDKRLTWRYGQRKGKPKEYAAEIVIESDIEA